jgi:acetylornithine deacetylase
VRQEVESLLRAETASDAWLADHPIEFDWFADYPPYAVGVEGRELVQAISNAAARVGEHAAATGLNSWHDAASLGLVAEVPAVSYGPGPRNQAHRPDEKISVDRLVRGAQTYSSLILDWCGSERTTHAQ